MISIRYAPDGHLAKGSHGKSIDQVPGSPQFQEPRLLNRTALQSTISAQSNPSFEVPHAPSRCTGGMLHVVRHSMTINIYIHARVADFDIAPCSQLTAAFRRLGFLF